ncbi:MAG: hypothetical protein CM15mP122_0090 [Bacteroidota bacterium]|nr:MAG: hypothetical protein CM15mP122_0090 [Bacteroidota bacterium]
MITKNFDYRQNVLVTGGGAKNNFLIEKIKENNNVNFTLPSDVIIDYKESIIFGFLGVLRLRNEVNCLASVTGSSRGSQLRKYFYTLIFFVYLIVRV